MKVKDLIEKLQQLDRDLDVICISEDEKLLSGNGLFNLFCIESISAVEGEKVRNDDYTPSLKFGTSVSSQKVAVIEITCDF